MAVRLHTHYDTLGVDRHASAEELRTAYRRRAQSCHPDKLPGMVEAQALMVQINHAYAVLSDPPGRAAHDRWIETHEALLSAERAVWEATRPGAAWPWILLSATIGFSMVTVGTVLYKERVPPVVAPPGAMRAAAPPPSRTEAAVPVGSERPVPTPPSVPPGSLR